MTTPAKPAEVIQPARVTHVNEHWSVLELADGRLLLQHRTAHIYGTGEAVPLAKLDEPGFEKVRETLQHYGSDRLMVRCMFLEPDGSLHCDPMGISPGGEPQEPFCLLQPAAQSAGLHMTMHAKSFESMVSQAEEEF